ncbi:MAG: glutamate--tRNA ligase [Cyanobacteriota bacterium]
MAAAPSSVRVRLAPSPTGTLHIGTARTAVFNWLFARRHGGTFLLRIEDTDRDRSKPEYTANILAGLRWLGLHWDEEPVIQSARVELHRASIAQLLASGQAYRCYTSEEELTALREGQMERKEAPRYDNRHRHLTAAQEQAFIAEGRQAVVRFRIDDERSIAWQDMVRGDMRWSGADLGGDMVIARRAPAGEIGDPLYNLVVVVDDAAMAISHVIRGEDHIANTAKQILLYEALGLPLPQFAHTPLILNQEGRKLSKRDGVTSISDFQSLGYTAEALTNYMTLLGWSPPEGMGERFTLEEAATVFGFERVNRAGARFDWEKLNWLNAQVLHGLPPRQLLERLQPLWAAKGWLDDSQSSAALQSQWLEDLCTLLGPSLTLLADGVSQAAPFFERPQPDPQATEVLQQPQSKACLAALQAQLPPANSALDTQEAQRLLEASAAAAGTKKGLMMKSLRAALLGALQGPDLLSSWQLLHPLGEDRERIAAAVTAS